WLFHYYRVKSLTNQRTLLQASVEERTSEIRQQKQLLEARAVALSEQNDMLKRNNEEITEQKTQLIDMSRRVQDLAMDRISFFTNITHEFRTPITLIIGPTQRALKLSYNPQVIEQLNYVERNARYLLNLVNQLMDFRKLESGKMEIVRTRGNFVKMANEILTPFQPFAAERNITLRSLFHIPQPELDFDGDALRKVIPNLLSNAIKFTPDGGTVTFYAAMLPQGKNRPEPMLYLDITDSGNGIPESEINKVFDRFYQGKSQIKYPIPGSSGSGIGLYLCKSIVELFGGSIWARNNRTRGCSFRVLLPMSNVEEATNSLLPAPTAPASVPMVPVMQPSPGITILVVEDNNDMRRFICSVLRDKYNLLEASNGEEALSILLSNQVDFIISDLMMPVMDGLELSRRVKEDFAISHIPFLMLTAKTGQESRLESYRVGVDEYLLKPFDEELLLTRISNILENKRRHQSKFNIDMDVDELNIEDESRDKKFIDQVMEVVKNNYKNSYFEVGDFAEALGISRSLLNKKLQNLTRQSATKFMRNYRMSIARELILKNRKTRNMNVSEIAYEVGFNDSKYFTRCFTRQFNVTPSSMLNGDDT
ncbi:ATP-binding protein, partial [uncultured Muribaculum sp.]